MPMDQLVLEGISTHTQEYSLSFPSIFISYALTFLFLVKLFWGRNISKFIPKGQHFIQKYQRKKNHNQYLA